ncbi:hypothetical protein [Paenibacillus rubinfantis]|uniref:hypothetical protein n=1 Tax=Paenibacillus rubinfantis TaxID=1720296 RepID=UPI001E59E31E|nr:hypothetical protein [Paenibacillus rubinfantis]
MLNRPHPKILIMTAVEAERQAVQRGLGSFGSADVELAGVGPASAAAATAGGVGASLFHTPLGYKKSVAGPPPTGGGGECVGCRDRRRVRRGRRHWLAGGGE